ncbi:hypothetical protein H6F86_06155 [Phormidium sp. FACHB-592]|uniref:Uncharacterized protein n=1 Tax=Stenomitos frigidus AS-A4 TaxID=2933935 RepID=A0ABV0KQ85_9CYAN|nr:MULTISPECIES: hypothetical protein [Cyanophyceae]MBD2036367.1 hypothetical protein [Leptolyngbya sp. FACHB-321]MBD2073473.1 hypothetical protein [Phormidium sp. FACHB-592]
MRSIQGQPKATLYQLVDHILAAGEISRQDHLQLTSILLAEQKLLDSERNKINRIFDQISTGRLKLIN